MYDPHERTHVVVVVVTARTNRLDTDLLYIICRMSVRGRGEWYRHYVTKLFYYYCWRRVVTDRPLFVSYIVEKYVELSDHRARITNYNCRATCEHAFHLIIIVMLLFRLLPIIRLQSFARRTIFTSITYCHLMRYNETASPLSLFFFYNSIIHVPAPQHNTHRCCGNIILYFFFFFHYFFLFTGVDVEETSDGDPCMTTTYRPVSIVFHSVDLWFARRTKDRT